jgi:DNA-binding NtrC family response regulator
VARLSVCVEGSEINFCNLPAYIRKDGGEAPPPVSGRVTLDRPVDLPAMLDRLETSYINAALEKKRGNRKAAAALLGLHRTTLVEKLRRRRALLNPVLRIV